MLRYTVIFATLCVTVDAAEKKAQPLTLTLSANVTGVRNDVIVVTAILRLNDGTETRRQSNLRVVGVGEIAVPGD